MTTTVPSNGIVSLAERLTDPTDRETYAHLISYVHSLPPGDELRRLVELLGLVSLIGQRIPGAAAELLAEMRAQAKAAVDYHAQVDSRLAGLPGEICAGVDVDEIAKSLGEAFRQQIGATGLQESAVLLRAAAKEITALSGQVATSLKPATREYQTVSATISAELAKLVAASRDLQRHNAQLVAQHRSNGLWWQATLALVLFLLGASSGILIEKRQTTDALVNVASQVERIQTPVLPPTVAPRVVARKR
jgi:hypothetical protein